jgi:hypothetical protein
MTAMAFLVNEKYPKPATNARQIERKLQRFFALLCLPDGKVWNDFRGDLEVRPVLK